MALQEMLQNLGGFQSLAANAQQMQQREELSANNRKASELLRTFYQSQKEGKPNFDAFNEAVLLSPEMSQNVLTSLGFQDKQQQQQAANDLTSLYQSLGNEQQFGATSAKLVNDYMAAGKSPDAILGVVDAYRTGGATAAAQALKPAAAAFVNQGFIKPEMVGFGQREQELTPYQKAQLELREREVTAAEKRAGRPDTQVTIDNKQDSEIAKLSAKDYQTMIGRAAAANKEIATIGTLEKLSEKAFSGTGAGALLSAAKVLNQFGIETEGLKESEVYEKLANTLVLDKSQQMSGALSNADMTFLQNTVPTLDTSKEGRKLTFDISRRLAEREKEVAKLATEYRRNNKGAFDMGEFQLYLDEWKEKNPLFPESKENEKTVSWSDLQ